MAESKSPHGRTLWDLMATYPKISLSLVVAILTMVGLFSWTLINRKYTLNSPLMSLSPPVPVISQDTSKLNKLDTSANIKVSANPQKIKSSSGKQIVITKPDKKPVESNIVNTNPVNVTSINQNGGITANQVNIGSNPRKLDLTVSNQLLTSLTNKDEKIEITSVMGDPESLQFASEIKAFLLSQGYTKVDGINQALFTQPVIGQFLDRNADGVKILIGSKK